MLPENGITQETGDFRGIFPFMEHFDESYYSLFYRNYDLQNPLRKLAYYRTLVERAVESLESPRILELGCAFGKFLRTLPSTWQLFGTDPNSSAINKGISEAHHVTFRISSLPEIPFEGDFDAILAFDVLEHVCDLERTALSVAHHLRAGGSFIFVVPVYDGPTGPIIRALDKDITHLHKCSRAFWLQWASRSFTVASWNGILRYLFPWGYYLHIVTLSLRAFTPAIAVWAKRQGAPKDE